jgi:gliding motility-associated-like protein
MLKFILQFVSFFGFLFYTTINHAQTFNPIPISGFTDDVIAEAGTSSLTTTTNRIDGGSSNKVMYTQAFRTTNAFGGGGIPDNGTLSITGSTFQLAPYNGLNCAIIPRSTNRDITLNTPNKYSALRLAVLTTEGSSLANATIFFSDGTSTQVVTNVSVSDWFNGTTNVIIQGFGRCTRATPASGADAFTSNPRMYFINLPLTCAMQQKNITKINVANVTTAGTNAPFPNLCVFALSGVSYTAVAATTSSTNATCNTQGTATVNITAGAAPYTIAWNSTPAQNTATATNLAPGTYTATVTDAGGCASTFSATVGQVNNLTFNNRTDTTICFGASFVPNLVSNGTSFSWSPTNGVSDPTTLNPTLNPTVSTTYTVTANIGTGCTLTRTFRVNVNQAVIVNAGADVAILAGASTQLQGSSVAGTYLWTPSAGLSNTNTLNPIATPAATTTYTLRVTTAQGCTNTDDVTVTIIPYCIKVMKAFTPNGDAIHDKWKVYDGVNCTKRIRVNVYNRYGGLIYNNENYQNNWDGTYSGKPVADGTYYYTLSIVLINDQVVTAKGDVTILR